MSPTRWRFVGGPYQGAEMSALEYKHTRLWVEFLGQLQDGRILRSGLRTEDRGGLRGWYDREPGGSVWTWQGTHEAPAIPPSKRVNFQ